jgi:hypothetical protein
MAARSRFSTSTVIDSEYIVPWLSAEGPLAYSPTKPPARDYFFQYTWILPGIYQPSIPAGQGLALSGHRTLVSVACDSGPKNSRPLTGKYGESTCASRQTCCRTPSCLSTRLMTASSAARPEACATGLGWATSWPRGRIRHSITRLRQGSLARRPAVVFARTSNGSSEVRSPPCCRQDLSEQHPDHDVLRG